tara:strand:+ start:128 stop:973 length:846 start_codon:yes stop_codon:yes gene_type:complete
MNQKINLINYKSNTAAEELVESLHSIGFAVIKNHPIDYNIFTSVTKEWERFFKMEEKHKYTFDPKLQDGYFPLFSENAKGYKIKDLKEFFHYYEWGKYPIEISEDTKSLYQSLLSIGNTLLHWIDSFTPQHITKTFSMPLSKMSNQSSMNLMRIIHYPSIDFKTKKGAIRAAAHGDINLITILAAATEPGLQVLSKNKTWIDVECNPGWLVINTGDMLQECTNGFYPSTIHRVINPKDEKKQSARFSMPVFIHPRPEVKLSERYTSEAFLNERLKEIGLKK